MRQTRALRAAGDFPMLLWKDIPPQHFETIFGEYPAHKPKPPMDVPPGRAGARAGARAGEVAPAARPHAGGAQPCLQVL